MRYTKLGKSDLSVSRICLGCMGFGDAGNGQHSWTVDEEHTREIIKRALELGVNFFDTAIGYQSGTSEQYVGRAVRDFAKREDVVVVTKFLPRTEDEITAGISGQRHIERMLNTSLSNLGLDYVDLYIYTHKRKSFPYTFYPVFRTAQKDFGQQECFIAHEYKLEVQQVILCIALAPCKV